MGVSYFENDALAPEEPNVYRLRSLPLFSAPAERNVLMADYVGPTFRSAGAKNLRSHESINIRSLRDRVIWSGTGR